MESFFEKKRTHVLPEQNGAPFFGRKKREEEAQKKLLEIPKTSLLVGDKQVMLEAERKKEPIGMFGERKQEQIAAKKPALALLEENRPLLLENDIEGRARKEYELAVKRERKRLEAKKERKKKRRLRRKRRKSEEGGRD